MNLVMLETCLGAAEFFRAYPDARVSTLEEMSDEDMDPELYSLLSYGIVLWKVIQIVII
jgi:hypothetical protein